MDGKGESTSYLRFYPDGQVIQGSVLSSANAGEVVSWFGKNSNVLSKGSYVLTPEGKLEFATQSMMGEVSYQGSVAGNALHLNSKSRINGHEAEKDYEFMTAPGIQ
ncbi:hypothetical protein [Thiolinea disciformis]|uniref:hypothetical protein n=1 Tax=Thiolinea disciformis TaxID=125614 RepID=UPI0003638534|nr:hypothetical protein [Thiolinea disciformis]